MSISDFGMISDIDVRDASTWEDRCFLTFDLDWCHDDVLLDCIDLVERKNVKVTWFVTHATPLLERLKSNPNFELGIHPNFNYLLLGDDRNGKNPENVIERLLAIVPDSVAVRSHSMTQSSNLLQLFVEKGLNYDCNHFIPEDAKIELKPWKLWNGLIKVPYFWEDDLFIQCKTNDLIKDIVKRKGIKVFDFHPIHVFLNTENIERYETTRYIHQIPDELKKYVYKESGTRNYLKQLLGMD